MVYKMFTPNTTKHHQKPKLQNKNDLSHPTLTKIPTNREN